MAYPYYGYQPQYYQPPMADQLAQLRGQQYQPVLQSQVSQQAGQGMIWVAGYQEAAAYLVAPNSAVALWDSSAPVIYLKQADASGKPSMKTYDLVERNSPVAASAVEYATREDLAALSARVDALCAREAALPKTAGKDTKEDA